MLSGFHFFSRRDALLGLAASAISAPALACNETLASIVRRHTKAMGGAAALDRIRSKRAVLAIQESGQRFDAVYQCTADPAWRIDIYVGGKHMFCEGLDAAGPWLWPGGDAAARDAVPDARRTGIQGIEFHLFGLHRFPERGHMLTLDAPQMIDGVRYHVIRVVMRDAYETFLFINPANWLIERRRDERAPHPDIDAKRKFVETRYSDFRSVQGVVSAFRNVQTDLNTGKTINTSTVESVAYNRRFASGTFTRRFVAPADFAEAR